MVLAQDAPPVPFTPPSAPLSLRFEPAESQYYQSGKASWYGGDFHKRRTASGVYFDMHGFTAAHRKLPFGSIVVVTDLSTGKKTMVCVTDRGPFMKSKILDLSWKAASELGGNLQNISAEAYIPEKCTSQRSDSNLRLSFLADCTPLLLDFTACSVVDSTTDFTKAIKLQRELTAASPDIRYAVTVVANPTFTGTDRALAGKYIYLVGAVLSNALPPEEITSADVMRDEP
ncbi:MAG: septal ring lytic transglycosylase RlpA family protein [Candidatus Kapaibacterium sp.]